MDEATFFSVSKTHRAIIVEEAWRSVSISAEVSARIMEKCFMTWTFPYNDYVVRKSRSPCQSSGGSGYSSGK
jgi:pyruvate/2-oxoglutarate/acetoin dehydrogenase E1 component